MHSRFYVLILVVVTVLSVTASGIISTSIGLKNYSAAVYTALALLSIFTLIQIIVSLNNSSVLAEILKKLQEKEEQDSEP